MRVDGILFDKDGTLFDFQKTWAPWVERVIEHLAAGDEKLANDLANVWEFDRKAGLIRNNSIITAGEVQDVAATALPLLKGMDIAELFAVVDGLGAKAEGVAVVDLPEFLTGLAAKGLKLGVATNDSESTAFAQLNGAGITQMFDYIVGYDSGHGGKPAPGQCVGFLDATGLAPDRVVMVGDSLHDLHAGKAAGMQTIGVLTGLAGRDELTPHADIVLPDIGHIPEWLKG